MHIKHDDYKKDKLKDPELKKIYEEEKELLEKEINNIK